jgi:hypothetical protein
MAALKGQMAALRQTSDDLGLGMRAAVDAAETAGVKRLRDQATLGTRPRRQRPRRAKTMSIRCWIFKALGRSTPAN